MNQQYQEREIVRKISNKKKKFNRFQEKDLFLFLANHEKLYGLLARFTLKLMLYSQTKIGTSYRRLLFNMLDVLFFFIFTIL